MPMNHTIPELAERYGDLTASQFSKTTGVSENNAYKLYQTRDRVPTGRTMELICKAYDCQPGDFLSYVKPC